MTEQLKALAEAATKGPWKHYGLDGGHLVFEDAAGSSIASSIGRNHVENAKYIAAANPERILALIAENERYRVALKQMIRGYVSLLESGRDRILQAGGECDSVEKMEASDPNLRDARKALGETK